MSYIMDEVERLEQEMERKEAKAEKFKAKNQEHGCPFSDELEPEEQLELLNELDN